MSWQDNPLMHAELRQGNFKERSWFSKNVEEPVTKFIARNFFGFQPSDYLQLTGGWIVPMSESGTQFGVSETNADVMFFCATSFFAVFKLAKISCLKPLSNSLPSNVVKNQSQNTQYARVDNISNIEKYGQSLGKDNQLFLTDSKTIDGLDLTTKAGLQKAEKVLGLPPGQLSDSEINVVTRVNISGLNVRLPTSGNQYFLPGGITSGGAPEIVVDPMNIFTDSSVTSIQFIKNVE